MGGYIIASLVVGLSHSSEVCFYIQCWRWPFLLEVVLLLPLCIAFNFVPREHINVKIVRRRPNITIDTKNLTDETTLQTVSIPVSTQSHQTSTSSSSHHSSRSTNIKVTLLLIQISNI
jgi:hypothetical protein